MITDKRERPMADLPLNDELIDIAIIGGGIGGVSAAIALERAGFEVEVFEQAAALRELGGAIVIREPSMTLLGRWGILDQLRSKMVAVNQLEMRDSQGKILGAIPTAVEAGEGEFAYCAHRADVHDALVSQLRPERLHLGHRLASVRNRPGHAEAIFEHGGRIRARLIVGADGLRSVVRTLLDATPMTFLNRVVHRTIAPASLLPSNMPNDRIRVWHADNRVMNLIPIRGGMDIGISAAIPAQTPPEALWSTTPAEEILSIYADFDPLLARLIKGRTVEITTHPIYDKAPIERWADGRVVLLGDAAHPMAPMNGQGANQAIQDAIALAVALCGRDRADLASALAEYQFLRAPVTARIQGLSRKPPAAMKRFAVMAS
jgi:salicylate hydroxylase